MSILKTFFSNLNQPQNIKNVFNEPYKLDQTCLLSLEIFCKQNSDLYQNYELFYWRDGHVDVFQITVVFVFVYNNKAVYEHEETVNFQ